MLRAQSRGNKSPTLFRQFIFLLTLYFNFHTITYPRDKNLAKQFFIIIEEMRKKSEEI